MPDAPVQTPSFSVELAQQGEGFHILVRSDGQERTYAVQTDSQQGFSDFYRQLATDFGTRMPEIFGDERERPEPAIRWRPLLTENVHPQILAGYGDPAILKTNEGYWLVATSNDAPDAFPLLHSNDLLHWEPKGFVFPQGREPAWTAKGRNIGDFWAPEMAKVGDEYWLCYTARNTTKALAIGLARSTSPAGPWIDNGAPLITGARGISGPMKARVPP